MGAISAMKETGRVVVLCHGGVGVEGGVVGVEAVDGVVGGASEREGDMGVGKGFKEEDEGARIKRATRLDQPIGEHGGVRISVRVETTAKTGIEMEALTGVMGAALNVVDMVKGVDKGVVIEEVKVVGKKGGRSGGWGVWEGKGAYGEEGNRDG